MKLSFRPTKNPNHHLWKNNGHWWLNLTVHKDDYTKERVRRSLNTQDIEHARRLRDLILENEWGHQ